MSVLKRKLSQLSESDEDASEYQPAETAEEESDEEFDILPVEELDERGVDTPEDEEFDTLAVEELDERGVDTPEDEEFDTLAVEELDERDEETPEDEEESCEKDPRIAKEHRGPRPYAYLPSYIAKGGAYKQWFIKRDYMITKASQARADIIRAHQLQGPSEELLGSIHMLTSHRYYDGTNRPNRNLFRQSALFAFGVLVEEMAKHAAQKTAGPGDNQQIKTEADENDNDNDTRSSQAPTTSS